MAPIVSLSLHLERDFRVHAIAGDVLIVDRRGEFFNVYRADASQRLRRFLDDVLSRVLPTLGRF
jgi:hypothetical protein